VATADRIEAQTDFILGEVSETPDITIVDSAADSYSKKIAHAAEQHRSDVKAAREAWFEGRLDL
jgi:hypothetical protein